MKNKYAKLPLERNSACHEQSNSITILVACNDQFLRSGVEPGVGSCIVTKSTYVTSNLILTKIIRFRTNESKRYMDRKIFVFRLRTIRREIVVQFPNNKAMQQSFAMREQWHTLYWTKSVVANMCSLSDTKRMIFQL